MVLVMGTFVCFVERERAFLADAGGEGRVVQQPYDFADERLKEHNLTLDVMFDACRCLRGSAQYYANT